MAVMKRGQGVRNQQQEHDPRSFDSEPPIVAAFVIQSPDFHHDRPTTTLEYECSSPHSPAHRHETTMPWRDPSSLLIRCLGRSLQPDFHRGLPKPLCRTRAALGERVLSTTAHNRRLWGLHGRPAAPQRLPAGFVNSNVPKPG
jgi:hypothetical protein